MLLPLLLNNLLAAATAPSVAGGGSSKRRYVVQRGQQLLVFRSQAAALAELQAQEQLEPVELAELAEPTLEPISPSSPALTEAPQQIDLAAMQAWAALAGQLAAYNAAYQSRHFGALLALFERLQDDDDVELLLLSL